MNTRLYRIQLTSLLSTFLFLASCSNSDQKKETIKETPIEVTLGVVTKNASDPIVASGQIESKETAHISTRLMGIVTSILVKPGDKVQKGQLLVTISNSDILAKRAQAQAMVTEAEAATKDALKDYERFEELYKKQSASAKEFENATLHYTSVKSKLETARQMKNEADVMLTYTNLVAPFSGVVTEKNMDAGSMASPGIPILAIEQTGDYHVQAAVSETEIGKLKEGMEAGVTIKSTGKTFLGKIFEISPSSQFNGGQYEVKVSIPEKEKQGLFSGMSVNVTISIRASEGDKNILIPYRAIIQRDQLFGLYTVGEDQTAQLRWVKVGKKYGEDIEILSGLNGNEKFIVESEGKLSSGAAVSVN